jgi:hypothetical protein
LGGGGHPEGGLEDPWPGGIVDVVEALREGPGTGWQQEGPEEDKKRKENAK